MHFPPKAVSIRLRPRKHPGGHHGWARLFGGGEVMLLTWKKGRETGTGVVVELGSRPPSLSPRLSVSLLPPGQEGLRGRLAVTCRLALVQGCQVLRLRLARGSWEPRGAGVGDLAWAGGRAGALGSLSPQRLIGPPQAPRKSEVW